MNRLYFASSAFASVSSVSRFCSSLARLRVIASWYFLTSPLPESYTADVFQRVSSATFFALPVSLANFCL